MTERRRLREFLLGGLAAGDAEALEERMFEDDAVYHALEEEHEALVEEYVAESLAGEDAARFERQRSLSPELTRRVAGLRDLKTLLEHNRRQRGAGLAAKRSFWRPLPVAIAVCIFGLLLCFCVQWRENRRLRAEVAHKAEGSQAAASPIPAQAARTEGVVFLAAGVMRGAQDVVHVEVAPGTSVMQLQIQAPGTGDEARSWAVEVTRNGHEIFRCNALFARRAGSIRYLPIYVAGEALTEGFYSVRIQATGASEVDESRSFIVQHASSHSTHLPLE